MSTRFRAFLLALGLASAAHSGLAQAPASPGGTPATPDLSSPASVDPGEEAAKAMEADLKRLGAQSEGKGKIGSNAEIDIPEGYLFFPAKGSREIMERSGNLVDGSEDGLIRNTQQKWSVLFSFSDEGYVKDTDKSELDADKMLKAMKDGEPAVNEALKKAGLPAQHTLGFVVPPKYNETTNNLEWAQRFTVEGQPGEFVNYNTKLLGRKGVMTATLMVDPDKLEEVLPEYQKALTGYKFLQGETYAEYRQGDKLATYGLTGLVLGGGAFAAAKMGLFAKLGMLIAKGGKAAIAGIVIVVAGIGKLLSKLFGGRNQKQFEQ